MTMKRHNELKAARAEHRRISIMFGGGRSCYLFGKSHKTELARDGYAQFVAHLLPARESIAYAQMLGVDTTGWKNLCVGSTRGCRAMCLSNSGQLAFSPSKRAAFVRSYIWQTDRELFETIAQAELPSMRRQAGDNQLVLRAMGTHDGAVERDLPNLVDDNPDVLFNDYTKIKGLQTGWVRDHVYRCRSASELTTDDEIRALAAQGLNITIPFALKKGEPLPETYVGVPVIDGDYDDLRFLDPLGVVVGLRYKRAVKRTLADSHGFIRPVPVSIGR